MGSTVMVLVIVALGVGVVAAVLVALLSRGVRDDAQDGASAAELVVAEIDAQLTRRAGLTARLAGLAPAGSGKAQSAVARAVTAAEVAA